MRCGHLSERKKKISTSLKKWVARSGRLGFGSLLTQPIKSSITGGRLRAFPVASPSRRSLTSNPYFVLRISDMVFASFTAVSRSGILALLFKEESLAMDA